MDYKTFNRPLNTNVLPYDVVSNMYSVLKNCKEQDFDILCRITQTKTNLFPWGSLFLFLSSRTGFAWDMSPKDIIKRFSTELGHKFESISDCYSIIVNVFENYIPSAVFSCLCEFNLIPDDVDFFTLYCDKDATKVRVYLDIDTINEINDNDADKLIRNACVRLSKEGISNTFENNYIEISLL